MTIATVPGHQVPGGGSRHRIAVAPTTEPRYGSLAAPIAWSPVPAGVDIEFARAIAEGDLPAVVQRVRSAPLPRVVTGDGQTCVMLAARFDRPALLRGFIARGGQVDARTSSGMTALMLAAGRGSCPCTLILLAAGADPTLENQWKRTALDVARVNGRAAVVTLLHTWEPPPGRPPPPPGIEAEEMLSSARRAPTPTERAALIREALDFVALLDVDTRWGLAGRVQREGDAYGCDLLADVTMELDALGRADDAARARLQCASIGGSPSDG